MVGHSNPNVLSYGRLKPRRKHKTSLKRNLRLRSRNSLPFKLPYLRLRLDSTTSCTEEVGVQIENAQDDIPTILSEYHDPVTLTSTDSESAPTTAVTLEAINATDSDPVTADPVTQQGLVDCIRNAIRPFLHSRAGGRMSLKASNTSVNRMGQFIIWAHRYLNDDADPPTLFHKSTAKVFKWTMKILSEQPYILESYIAYQCDVIQRGPSTILNHLDALTQFYNFVVYDGRLPPNGKRLKVPADFHIRYPFFVSRYRRTLRKQLKQYK